MGNTVVVLDKDSPNDTIECAIHPYIQDGYRVVENVIKGDKRFITLSPE